MTNARIRRSSVQLSGPSVQNQFILFHFISNSDSLGTCTRQPDKAIFQLASAASIKKPSRRESPFLLRYNSRFSLLSQKGNYVSDFSFIFNFSNISSFYVLIFIKFANSFSPFSNSSYLSLVIWIP